MLRCPTANLEVSVCLSFRYVSLRRVSRIRSTRGSSTSTPSRCWWEPKTDKVRQAVRRRGHPHSHARGLARASRNRWARTASTTRTCRRCHRRGRSPTSTTRRRPSIRWPARSRSARKDEVGRVYYPAPYMTNDNLEYYEDTRLATEDRRHLRRGHRARGPGAVADACSSKTPPPRATSTRRSNAWKRKGIKPCTTSGCARWRCRAPRWKLRQLHAEALSRQRLTDDARGPSRGAGCTQGVRSNRAIKPALGQWPCYAIDTAWRSGRRVSTGPFEGVRAATVLLRTRQPGLGPEIAHSRRRR